MIQDDQSKTIYSYYSNIKKKEIDWLWYPYIPYGKLTLLQGDPGEGKSTFMLQVAALLTKGSPLPDGYSVPEPVNVVYQCSEDDVADTIKPRLMSAGADCSKVAYIIDDDGSLNLEDTRIETTIAQTNARLFILDPLQSYLSQDSDMQQMGRMRVILGKLAVIAAKYKCAIVLIGHMNKTSSAKNMYRGLGSIDINAIARSVLMIVRDQYTPQSRYMIQIKSSLAPEGEGVGFRLDKQVGFQWSSDIYQESMETEPEHASNEKRSTYSDVLIEMLADGPMPSVELLELFTNLNVSKRTLYTLKKELGIISFRKEGIWYWELPSLEGVNDHEETNSRICQAGGAME